MVAAPNDRRDHIDHQLEQRSPAGIAPRQGNGHGVKAVARVVCDYTSGDQ